MAVRRLTKTLSVAFALLLWLCLGLAVPILVSLYSSEMVSDVVEASPSDAYSITEPVVLSDAPLVRIERGTIAIVDANGNSVSVSSIGTGTAATAQGIGIRLFNATITFAGEGKPQQQLAGALSPFVDILLAARHETLTLRRTTVLLHLAGDVPEAISDVKADVSLRRKGLVSIKGTGLLRGHRVAIDAAANIGQLERKVPGPHRLPLKLALKGDHIDFAFDGRMTMAADEMGLQGQGELSMPSGRQVVRMFGSYWASGPGLRDLSVRGQVSLARQTIAFENATARMDGNEATGVLALRVSAPRPVLTGTLAYKSFDAKPYLTGSASEPFIPLSWTSLAAGALTVPLGMHLDADLRLSAERVMLGNFELGRSAATVALKDGRLLADLTDLKFNGGEGGGQINADFTGYLPKVTVRAKLDRVDLGLLAGTMTGHALVHGQANIVADLTGAGGTMHDVLKGLAGKVVVRSQSGGRIAADLRGLASAARKGDVKGWQPAARGTTAFDQLDLRLVLREGTLLTETAEAKSADGAWSATGVVNLNLDRIDVRLTQTPGGGGAAAGGSARQTVLELQGPLREPTIKAAADP